VALSATLAGCATPSSSTENTTQAATSSSNPYCACPSVDPQGSGQPILPGASDGCESAFYDTQICPAAALCVYAGPIYRYGTPCEGLAAPSRAND
jgi:hypothetical protein